ncbi:hypothetical protein [Streptococcus pluranimalium]|uniref:Lipoprotein n=1 Tax=Streptococcus pluranimalium TaxID=82348 RepID=A0A2L0D3U5_9STRE|nr:hypothetical protein [Streptococcus pluranimalium]AUW96310.1 hypothetical protein C0J00_03850 [Streptococcus pluranimalium]
MKKFLLVMLVIGGLMMVGCDRKNSRSWLENKFGNELSRVYPTENLEDLFEEFPDGFGINQTLIRNNHFVEIELYGDESDNSISGSLVMKDLSTPSEKIIADIPLRYERNSFTLSGVELAKEYWDFDGFLFQKLKVNSSLLSEMKLKDKSYNFQNGDMRTIYQLNNSEIEEYLKISNSKKYNLGFGGSDSNRGYYYTIFIENQNDANEFYFSERVLDANN